MGSEYLIEKVACLKQGFGGLSGTSSAGLGNYGACDVMAFAGGTKTCSHIPVVSMMFCVRRVLTRSSEFAQPGLPLCFQSVVSVGVFH